MENRDAGPGMAVGVTRTINVARRHPRMVISNVRRRGRTGHALVRMGVRTHDRAWMSPPTAA